MLPSANHQKTFMCSNMIWHTLKNRLSSFLLVMRCADCISHCPYGRFWHTSTSLDDGCSKKNYSNHNLPFTKVSETDSIWWPIPILCMLQAFAIRKYIEIKLFMLTTYGIWLIYSFTFGTCLWLNNLIHYTEVEVKRKDWRLLRCLILNKILTETVVI